MTERGSTDRVTLRFDDDELERRYQREAGREGLGGFRLIAGSSLVLWAVAAWLVPIGTDIPASMAVPVCLAMAVLSLVALVLGRWAQTLDRQHAVASGLTIGNGLVILALASAGGVLPGFAVSAIMLLLIWGFVSRTRFAFAAFRTAVIAIGFLIAAANHTGPTLLLDGFIFTAAAVGSLLALRILERTRRSIFHQDLVIREQSADLEREKGKSDRLLLNVMPASVSERLREGADSIADEYPAVSILFADIVGFTELAARLSPGEVIRLLSELYTRFDDLAADRGLEKIKTVGDSYMAAGGLPEPLPDHATRVVDLGLAMIAAAARPTDEMPVVHLRIGVHSGPAVGGVIGSRKFAFDVWGDTVNVASRLESQGRPDRVHISEATWQLVRDEFECESQATVELRGHGPMTTYLVVGPSGHRAEAAVDPTNRSTPVVDTSPA
jgi:class 3 adenylate cyclase